MTDKAYSEMQPDDEQVEQHIREQIDAEQLAERQALSVQAEALLKENITEAVLRQIETDFTGLIIAGIDDKQGYEKVRRARLTCVKLRTTTVKICKAGREDAKRIVDAWLAEEKRVVARIAAVEAPLIAEEKRIDDEVERLRREAQEALNRRTAERMTKLAEVEYALDYEAARDMDDADFETLLNEATTTYNDLREQQRLEAKRREAEEAERQCLAEAEAARLRAAQDELDRQREELEAKAREIERRELEQQEREEAARREEERKAEEQRRAAEMQAEYQRAAEQALLDEQRRAAEAQSQREAEEQRLDEERRRAQLPDKEKLAEWIHVLGCAVPDMPEMSTDGGQLVAAELLSKLQGFERWALAELQKLD